MTLASRNNFECHAKSFRTPKICWAIFYDWQQPTRFCELNLIINIGYFLCFWFWAKSIDGHLNSLQTHWLCLAIFKIHFLHISFPFIYFYNRIIHYYSVCSGQFQFRNCQLTTHGLWLHMRPPFLLLSYKADMSSAFIKPFIDCNRIRAAFISDSIGAETWNRTHAINSIYRIRFRLHSAGDFIKCA